MSSRPRGNRERTAATGRARFRQMNAGDRERGSKRQPVVHEDAREHLPGPGSEPVQEPLELPVRHLPVPQLEEVHPERAQFEEMVGREAADGADRAGDGAPRRAQVVDDGAPRPRRVVDQRLFSRSRAAFPLRLRRK